VSRPTVIKWLGGQGDGHGPLEGGI
jgi:hypothetical protein